MIFPERSVLEVLEGGLAPVAGPRLLRFVDRSTNLSNFDSVDADVSVETNVDIVGTVIKATIVNSFIFKATIVKSIIFKANVV